MILVLLGQCLDLRRVAADQDRIGHDPITVGQCHPALIPDRDDGADEVLVGAHASRDAVHDDADPVGFHEEESGWKLG